ncbi:MAG TPA: phage holin family protein [Candidatus Saccharimonadales bacterium]
MKNPFARLLLRWFVCSLGLWIAAGLLSGSINYDNRASVIIIGGLILALVNIVIKPIIVIFALPALLLTLGLFMVIINGLMVWLASAVYDPLHVSNFWAAVFAGMVIGLVNYLVTTIIETDRTEHAK